MKPVKETIGNKLKENGNISEIIEACKQNDSRAQLKLYNLFYKAMYNTALRIVNNSDDAEDVMQNAFMKAFTKLDKYRFNATFGAWLKRIVINEAISWLRKQKNNLFVPIDERKIEITENEPFINSEVDINNVLKAISNLKSNYRIVFSLYYIEGYDYEEIGQILNISYANARAIMSRAKQKLKQELMATTGYD